MTNPRRAAWRVLTAVNETPQRLEKALYQELSQAKELSPSNRALVSNLVYTILRNRLYLDHLISRFVKRPLRKLDPPVLDILRLGGAELVLMNTPDHAAVNEAVNLSKKGKARRAGGLINGTLRAMARGWQGVKLPTADKHPVEYLSIRYSHPPWMVKELRAAHSLEEVEAWLAAGQDQPLLCIRVNSLKAAPEALIQLLAQSEITTAPHALDPGVLVLQGAKGPSGELPGHDKGLFQIQDPGAAAVTRLLGVAPGQKVLDLCAGSGGKTGHLAALMENSGELLAVEPSPGRFKALKKNLKRLGVKNVRPKQTDGLKLDPELGPFDRILIDAPCTGLGVMGRRPDVRWRREPQDSIQLAKLQLSLLKAGARLLAPEGALLYCTCTFTRRENEQVVKALLAAEPNLGLEWEPDTVVDSDGYFRTRPHRDNSDAFFAARLVRKA